MKSKIFFLTFCMIFLIGIGDISAFQLNPFGNVQSYNQTSKTATIQNTFFYFPTSTIATATLNTPQVLLVGAGYQKVAQFTINSSVDYANALSNLRLYDRNNNNKSFTRQIDYKYLIYQNVSVPDYSYSCFSNTLGNGTILKTCSNVATGTSHVETREVWNNLSDFNFTIGQNITIGLFTNVQVGDNVEWVGNIMGVDMNQWSTWTQSLNVNLDAYYKFDTGSGITYFDSLSNNNLSMTSGFMGLWTTQGKINGGAWFNGNSSMGVNGSNFTYNPGQFTVAGWYNITTGNSGHGGAFGVIGFNIYHENNNWTCDTNSQTPKVISSAPVSSNGYHFVVCVWDKINNNVSLYIDGNLNSSAAMPNNASTDNSQIQVGNIYPPGSSYWAYNGTIDEVGVWNRSLTSAEITQLYNGGMGISYALILSNSLISPTNNTYSNETTQFFVVNSSAGSYNLTNVTNNIWFSNGTLFNSTTMTITGNTYNVTNLTVSRFIDGNYSWGATTCQGDGNGTNCTTSSNNTLIIDTIPPVINIVYPQNTTYYTLSTNSLFLVWINYTATNTNLRYCWLDFNFTNSTPVLCNTANFSKVLTQGSYNFTIWANDSAGNLNSSTQWATWIILKENTITYNPFVYETQSQTFYENVTTNGTAPTSASLYYNGILYNAAVSLLQGNNYNISATIDIPTGVQNNSFNFVLNFMNQLSNGTASQQNVSQPVFGLCSSTNNVSYLNFTFADEVNGSILNATNDLTSATYWLGSGTTSKTLSSSNATANSNYTFCLTQSSVPVYTNMTFKYSNTGYPVRTFQYVNQSFTNATTHQVLYMLSSGAGIYTTLIVVNSQGTPISGVDVLATRILNGSTVQIGQGITGSDGSITFWVNPNYQHTFTASKSGYQTNMITITPTQPTYTISLSSSGSTITGTVSGVQGITYIVAPLPGPIQNGTTNFNVTVYSNLSNIVNCMFQLLNETNISQILASSTGMTNSSYCFLNIPYAATRDQNLFGRLSVWTTNSSGWVIMDSDWKWVTVHDVVNTWNTITNFFQNFAGLGNGNGIFGSSVNEGEFSVLVIFFIVTTIFIGTFGYFMGIELNNPGASLIIIESLLIFASFAGFFTFTSGSPNITPEAKQYGILIVGTMMVTGWGMRLFRRSFLN